MASKKKMKAPASTRFDESQLSQNPLACPFSYGCQKSFSDLGKLGQHLKKSHGAWYNCESCGQSLKVGKHHGYGKIQSKQSRHQCTPGAIPQQVDVLDEEKLGQLKKLGKERNLDREERLRRTYEICGVSTPECYHVRPLHGESQCTNTPISEDSPPAPVRPGRRGFVTPEVAGPDIPPPTQPLTAEAVNYNQNFLSQRGQRYSISGRNTKTGSDSGYASMIAPYTASATAPCTTDVRRAEASDYFLMGAGSGLEQTSEYVPGYDDVFRPLSGCSDSDEDGAAASEGEAMVMRA
ncbi:hypothetical protein QBC34DRAFT_24389 [Podospora aff. communis PSN243]|uniref:C2H2-type domain-containing protein n=1 Tax=Podospora aff. communis PSN243 TaxID=3040156 RepID=A0AAV9G203_9PEZI|nr:hypothetical protein QBC34DRAFT_24389 [Podospora aff. communis PSN243]